MRPPKINDPKLLRLIDKQGMNQAEEAKELGVSRQAVSRRLQEIREIALQACGEIRNQIKLQFEIFQALYSLQEVEVFQKTVLEVLG